MTAPARPSKDAQVFSFRAPRSFFDDLERGLFVRPDGEVVTITVRLDEANRWAVPRFRTRARTDGWRVRLARWLLGAAEA